MKFKDFLSKISASYTNINRFRAFLMYEKFKNHFHLKPIIHIVGTNGKGSSGRFLAQLLESLDYKVGHFSSPHIFKFNERFYENGEILSDERLERAHEKLALIFKDELYKISYFEYCTFLAAICFKNCDFVVFEAGLGGEFDATNVFDKRLSIFTKIGLDHTQILGDNLEEIARTKLKAMSSLALISNEQEEIVLDLAEKIALLKNARLKIAESFDENSLNLYIKKYNLPKFLAHNLNLALNALELLLDKERANLALSKLKKLNLPARFDKIDKNLFVDVGHNEMAARMILENFKDKKIILVYNAFLDKDIKQILSILKPILRKILIFELKNEERIFANKQILKICENLNINCEIFDKIKFLKNFNETILVFGSFVLVENFIKFYKEDCKNGNEK